MGKKDEFLLSNLYINKVSITKEIPKDNYLKELSVVKHLVKTEGIRFRKPVTFLVGENGVGKSTLIDEKVFSIPGIGKLAVDAMMNRDLPLLQGTVMYIATVFVVVNLVVDLSYALIDPRIRFGKGGN